MSTIRVTRTEIGTSLGPALADLVVPAGSRRPSFLVALTHGAGGTAGAPDLLAARDAAVRLGGAVALITQPYRVRGARAPGSPARQDEAWREIIVALRGDPRAGPDLPLIVGGRSNGARVACRTAAAVGAAGVIALAFPLRPPARRSPAPGTLAAGNGGVSGPVTREADLLAAAGAAIPVLVVNGDRDPFGIPAPGGAIRVVTLPGESHSLSRNPAAVADAVTGWLSDVLPPLSGGRRARRSGSQRAVKGRR